MDRNKETDYSFRGREKCNFGEFSQPLVWSWPHAPTWYFSLLIQTQLWKAGAGSHCAPSDQQLPAPAIQALQARLPTCRGISAISLHMGSHCSKQDKRCWKCSVTKSSRKASISIWGSCCGTWSDVQFYWAGEYIKVYKWTLLSSASFSSLMPFGSKNCRFSQHLDLHCRLHLRQSRMLCSAAAKQLLLLAGGLTPGQTGWHTGQGLPVWQWSHEGHGSWGLVKNKILLQLKII